MADINQAVIDFLDPLVQLERLEAWANSEARRFFELTRYSSGNWEVTLYLGTDQPEDWPVGQGRTMAEAIRDAFDRLEERGL